ncbi:MAG: dihydroorotate dehydrogenase [Nitrospirae bacterium]|nr:MAG: dihydroorotate dehydrogenase [Nitrospirota bacterium]
MNLEVKIGKIRMKNPVMTASGTFGYGAEFSGFFDLDDLGAIVVKGISKEPKEGNPSPRIWETPCGMLNAIGLQNVGLRGFMDEKLPYLRRFSTPVIVNILGSSTEEYVEIARALDGEVEGIEVNVSCPNVKEGGILFSSSRDALREVVGRVRDAVRESTLIVKLSPSTSDIGQDAMLCQEEGADAVSMINTIPAMAIDIETRRPRLANITGGLSGPAIRPVAVRMVWEAYKRVKIPIVGMGGIMTGADAVEFILAGATAVAVGTANFVNPSACIDIIDAIKDYMIRKGFEDVESLRGGMIWQDRADLSL